MSNFIHHDKCPKCGSRDNLAVYDDGHEWCFGCGYYKPARTTLDSIERRAYSGVETDNLPSRTLHLPNDISRILPPLGKQWLKKYRVTEEEIDKLNILWSESTGLLIFPQTNDNNEVTGYIGRQFKDKGPKYIIRGEKTKFNTIYGIGDTLVFTEDLISAVAVGRVAATKPLFGTYLREIPSGYSSYYLWLDKDKQISSIQQCRKWKQYGYNISSIITDNDPKTYSNQQIKEILNVYPS